MMVSRHPIPEALAERSHPRKRGWYLAAEAYEVLDWLDDVNGRFLGFDVAEQLEDGSWMLLIHPILDTSKEVGRKTAIRIGREFVAANAASNRIFEPVWEGRNT